MEYQNQSTETLVLSPSRVKKWIRCKRSYHWRYNGKLVRRQKSFPLTLGIVISEILADYYREDPSARSQELLDQAYQASLSRNRSLFLGEGSNAERLVGWRKLSRRVEFLLSHYHDFAKVKDDFEVRCVEERQEIGLTFNLSLLAIPDTIVYLPGDDPIPMILEHKYRSKFKLGDFGIDYQSAYSCLASGTLGTIYNVGVYSKGRWIRDTIMRSDYELGYFRDMLIHIGNDILNTAPEDMYPMPMGKCYCDYWELCNGEMTGLDLDDIISEVYVSTSKQKSLEEEEPEVKE